VSAVDVSPTSVAAGTSSVRRAGACAVRQAAAGDRPALERMLARCTGQTRYRRFHGPVNVFPERYLTEALSGSPLHFALVAYVVDERAAEDRAVVALASCRAVDEGVAELGVLVEDEWQRRGVGDRLLREIAAYAARTGLRALQAQVLAEQPWIVGMLRRYGTCTVAGAGQALYVTVSLPR
jgi:GNAT superfamily N-acetyltransferase